VYLKSIQLGAVPKSEDRAKRVISVLKELDGKYELFTAPGNMGEAIAADLGLSFTVVNSPVDSQPTAKNTTNAVCQMMKLNIDLLLFAGGDGTARDIYSVTGDSMLVLGIPSGVKIHSAVFATNPHAAGNILTDFVLGKIKRSTEAELVDLDEELYRKEVLTSRLFGYLKIPLATRWTQNRKSGSSPGELYFQKAIAEDLAEQLDDNCYYLVGPGTTTHTFLERLNISGSLLGVDLIFKGKLLKADLNEKEIIEEIKGRSVKLIVTPTGGQGFLLGRGNQQLSSEVLKTIGEANMIVIASPEKINALNGRPLLIDTGDEQTDRLLSGYYRVITGYHQYTVYRLSK
jgi:predicted polyphosphate/ATP-dependent NAD kinase